MVNVMRGIMQQKMTTQTQLVYLPVNETALSFNPYERPKLCEEFITKKRFA
jgi:hypothetical protein